MVGTHDIVEISCKYMVARIITCVKEAFVKKKNV